VKRDPSLISLSRDHHQALSVAQQLRRVDGETVEEARAAFLAFWAGHGRAHFRLEEDVLLPAFAGHGDSHHPLVARVLCDHVAIRQRADALTRNRAATVATLQELGVRLADHVRLEERELFPLIERAMPASQLAALADALDQAEGTPNRG
jgi:Hemerythrin HHE cation binding domain